MPRKPRVLSASGVYHFIWRGIDKQQLFHDDADNIKFLTFLNLVQSELFEVLAFCLMGNHVHMLVKTSKTDLKEIEKAMKRLGIRFAGYFNKRYDRVGPIFQGRYKSRLVESCTYFKRVLRYIHINPVESGFTENMEDYPWSSYGDYFGEPNKFCLVNIQYALEICDLDDWKQWHEEKENNPSSLLDSNKKSKRSDEELKTILQDIYHFTLTDLAKQNDTNKRKILRRLVYEEQVCIPQLSRLCGISRGEIRRCIAVSPIGDGFV